MVTIPAGTANRPSDASIEGTVVSAATGEPLQGATVTIARSFSNVVAQLLEEREQQRLSPVTVMTDSRGHFVVTGLVAGSYEAAIKRQGYFPEPISREESFLQSSRPLFRTVPDPGHVPGMR